MPVMKPCPQCGAVGTVTVAMRLVAVPFGTWSLSGVHPKVNCVTKAVLECSCCDLEVHGRLEGAEFDAATSTFTGGYFVADRIPVRSA